MTKLGYFFYAQLIKDFYPPVRYAMFLQRASLFMLSNYFATKLGLTITTR